MNQLTGVAGLGVIGGLMALVSKLGQKHHAERSRLGLWVEPERQLDASKYPTGTEGMRALVEAVKGYVEKREQSDKAGSMRDAYVAADDARVAFDRMMDALERDVQGAAKREDKHAGNNVRDGLATQH